MILEGLTPQEREEKLLIWLITGIATIFSLSLVAGGITYGVTDNLATAMTSTIVGVFIGFAVLFAISGIISLSTRNKEKNLHEEQNSTILQGNSTEDN